MPQVGQDIETARIVEWCKDEGEEVDVGDVVVVIESDKASFEIEAEEAGVLLKILHEPDEEVEIFKPLGYIGAPGDKIPDETAEAAAAAAAAEQKAPASQEPAAPVEGAQKPPGEHERINASPSARRLARERGIDLSTVRGTGPGGRITSEDVAAAQGAAAPQAPAAEDKVIPYGKMRRRAADRLTESVRNVPHFYLSLDADMTDALALRRKFNETGDAHVTVTDLVIKACATALREFEKMNAHAFHDRLSVKPHVNIGVAVAADEGLLVPVIADADKKSLCEIARTSAALSEHARRGALRSDAVGTFTVTSLGMYGIREFWPIINPPECGILAVGMIESRFLVFENGFAPRDVMTMVLAADHRAVDGAYAAAFLNRVRECLEDAETLFKETQ